MGRHLFVNAVRQVLTSIGYDVRVVPDVEVNIRALGYDDLLFFVDHTTAVTVLSKGRPRKPTILYFNTEPVKALECYPEKYRRRIGRYQLGVTALAPDLIFDYNLPTSRFWKRKSLVAYHCPMGYHDSYTLPPGPSFSAAVHSLGEELFDAKPTRRPPGLRGKGRESKLPDLKTRRGYICDSLRDARLPCRSYAFREDWPSVEKLNRSPGVHLNVNQVLPPFTFGPLRVISFCLANSRFVLSEPCNWYPKGLRAGYHWDVAPPEEFIDRVCYWWARPKERDEIGRAGFEFIRNHHRLDVHLPETLAKAGLFYG